MDTQMSQYPPPPTPDHQHYTPIYPAAAAAAAAAANAQLLSPAQAEQLQYSPPVDPSAYAKIEPGLGAPNSHLSHAHQPEQQAAQPLPPVVEGQQKTNRLRKACDSCSIRKVKVSMDATSTLHRGSARCSVRQFRSRSPLTRPCSSATRQARRVEHAQRWTFHARSRGPVAGAVRRTDMRKPSRNAGWSLPSCRVPRPRHRPHTPLKHWPLSRPSQPSQPTRYAQSMSLNCSSMTSSPTSILCVHSHMSSLSAKRSANGKTTRTGHSWLC